jgi:hypothetical protein
MRAAGLCFGLLLVSTAGVAQVRGRVDAGVGGSGSWSLAPEFGVGGRQTRIELTGEYRDFGGTGRGATGLFSGSVFRTVSGPLSFELFGAARGQTGTGLMDAGAWQLGPRLHLRQADQGLWLGVQGGRDPYGATLRWEAAAWKNLGRLSIQVQGWQTSANLAQATGDTLPLFPDTLTPPAGRQPRTTTDLGTWLRWNAARVQLMLASGVRFGLPEPGLGIGSPGDGGGMRQVVGGRTVSSTWWLAEGTWWLVDRLGIAGTVGRQPPDPSFDTPGRTFFRLGFRAALDRRRPAPAAATPLRRSAFRLRRLDPELVEFTLEAAGAEQVEIMADFTDWSAVPMERDRPGGIWRVRLPATPGLHRMNVRYDGGAWRAPPVTRVVRDEFGEESGELLIG